MLDLLRLSFRVGEFFERLPRRHGDFGGPHEFVAEYGAQALVIVVEILLQERNDARVPCEAQFVGALQIEKVAVPDLVIAVEQKADALVEL